MNQKYLAVYTLGLDEDMIVWLQKPSRACPFLRGQALCLLYEIFSYAVA